LFPNQPSKSSALFAEIIIELSNLLKTTICCLWKEYAEKLITMRSAHLYNTMSLPRPLEGLFNSSATVNTEANFRDE